MFFQHLKVGKGVGGRGEGGFFCFEHKGGRGSFHRGGLDASRSGVWGMVSGFAPRLRLLVVLVVISLKVAVQSRVCSVVTRRGVLERGFALFRLGGVFFKSVR